MKRKYFTREENETRKDNRATIDQIRLKTGQKQEERRPRTDVDTEQTQRLEYLMLTANGILH